jgi:hypothetical protein
MATRVLNFSRAHPDQASGSVAALSRLEAILARAGQVAVQQRDGISEVRAATRQKEELRRTMRRTQLLHLSRVAEAAGKERPELEQKFVLAPEATPYLAFRAATRGIAAEAEKEKALLLKHGLLESALQSLTQALDQFDRAVERGTTGRQAHVGARAELKAIADEVNQIVRFMDGAYRFGFASDAEALAAWESASNTFGPVRSAGQSVKPLSEAKGAGGQPVDTGKAADGSKGADHAA